MRTQPAADKATYTKMRSRAEKQAFRVSWAQSKLKAEQEAFAATRKLTQTSTQRGRWLTLKKISEELGGDYEAAVRYCKSCVALGPTEFYLNVK